MYVIFYSHPFSWCLCQLCSEAPFRPNYQTYVLFCACATERALARRRSTLPPPFLHGILTVCHVFNCRNTSFPSLWAAKRTRSICRGSRAASSTWVARWHRQVKINIFITFSSLTFSFIYLSPKSACILQMTVLSFRFNLKLLVYCQLSLN